MGFDFAQVVAYGITLSAVVTSFLFWFKRKPGQREQDEVAVAQGTVTAAEATVNVATGTVTMIGTALNQQFISMNANMAKMREELDDLYPEVRILRVDLRESVDALEAVTKERDRERELAIIRVEQLTAEVAALRQELRTRDQERDDLRDSRRDPKRDRERDESRDEKRDAPRDEKRDFDRDVPP